MDCKLLTTKEVAAFFGLSTRNTKALLIKGGLNPINVGKGKKVVDRWLDSAVTALIQNLHADAQQPKVKRPTKKRTPELKASVVSMSIDELFALTQSRTIQ